MPAATIATVPATATEGRDRVLNHARALFVERGFDGVSMQQIADAASLTKAALYYHFRDKEDLFGHVMRREMDRFRLGVVAALEGDGDLRSQLERIVRQVFASIRSDFGRLMIDLKEHVSSARREAIGCQPDPAYDLIRPRLEAAVAAGEIRDDLDLDLVVGLFFGMVFSQVQLAKLGGPEPPAEGIAAAIVEVLFCGIAPRAAV